MWCKRENPDGHDYSSKKKYFPEAAPERVRTSVRQLKMRTLTFLLLVLHTIQFVDPGSVVGRVSSERDLKGCQELVHSR